MTVISHKAMTMRSLSLELIVFSRPRVSGSTLGKNLGGCATLGFPPWLIPPHSVAKHYTNSLRSCIVTLQHTRASHCLAFTRSSLLISRPLPNVSGLECRAFPPHNYGNLIAYHPPRLCQLPLRCACELKQPKKGFFQMTRCRTVVFADSVASFDGVASPRYVLSYSLVYRTPLNSMII